MGDRKITNTKTLPPELLMLGLLEGGSRAIEEQEMRGQQELVNSTQLPTEGSQNPAWAKMGVAFGSPDANDPIFVPAVLPSGWKLRATNHAMWSDLVDDKGRRRAAIFYKAAFYDRSAHMNLTPRFTVRQVHDKDRLYIQHQVNDCDRQVFVTEAVSRPDGDWKKIDAIADQQTEQCSAWLADRYPQWQDASGHWDDDPTT